MSGELGIDGHGYQPPRVGVGPSGEVLSVFPDVNEVIYNQCYKPLFIERGLLPDGETTNPIPDVLSFSLFASLRGWIAANHPEDFAVLKENIRELPEKEYRVFGDPLIHAILPLQTRQNKEVLIRLGKEAFMRDFGFEPKGFWPPETAIDTETLEVLAENGYEFVVLRDDQVHERQQNPMFVKLPNGKEIAVVHFNMYRSGDVGYGDATFNPSEQFVEGVHENEVVAVDVETFGHHKPHGVKWLRGVSSEIGRRADRAVLSVMQRLRQYKNQKSYTSIYERSSWSCRHPKVEDQYPSVKLGRWQGTCACAPSETNKQKNELYHATQATSQEINNRLQVLDPHWEERYIRTLQAKEQATLFINGQYAQREMSVVDRIFAGVYQDLADEKRRETAAAVNFLHTLRRMTARELGIGADIPFGHPMYEYYLLFAAKVYSDLSLTSCAEFFPEPNRDEQKIARQMEKAAQDMLRLHETYAAMGVPDRKTFAA